MSSLRADVKRASETLSADGSEGLSVLSQGWPATVPELAHNNVSAWTGLPAPVSMDDAPRNNQVGNNRAPTQRPRVTRPLRRLDASAPIPSSPPTHGLLDSSGSTPSVSVYHDPTTTTWQYHRHRVAQDYRSRRMQIDVPEPAPEAPHRALPLPDPLCSTRSLTGGGLDVTGSSFQSGDSPRASLPSAVAVGSASTTSIPYLESLTRSTRMSSSMAGRLWGAPLSKVSLSVAGEEAWRLAEGGRPLSRSPGLYAGQQNPAFLVGTLPVCKAVRSAADTKLLRRHHLEQAFVAQGNGANQLEATGLTLVPLKKS